MSSSSKAIAIRRTEERDRAFPGAEELVWSRHGEKGFTTVPRLFPLIQLIQDALSVGAPVSRVYADLFFKAFDEHYIIIESPVERALFSGFSGPRAVTTWTHRMRHLVDLGFLKVKAGTKGEFHHTLIVNPYHAVAAIEADATKRRLVEADLWEAYRQRRQEVGIKDPTPEPVPTPTSVPAPRIRPRPARAS